MKKTEQELHELWLLVFYDNFAVYFVIFVSLSKIMASVSFVAYLGPNCPFTNAKTYLLFPIDEKNFPI